MLLFLIVVYSSCSKVGQDTKFSGKVYDQYTGAVLPNCSVAVQITYSDKFSGSSVDRYGRSTIADGLGNFSYILDDRYNRHEVGKTYVVTVFSSQWNFSYSNGFSPTYGEHNEVNHDIPVAGVGLIHIIVHNVAPFDANDNIGSFYKSIPGDLGNLPSFTGMNVNDTFDIRGISGPRLLHSTIIKNNVTTGRVDSITIPGFSEGYYDLYY
jgi:hypothetical protein